MARPPQPPPEEVANPEGIFGGLLQRSFVRAGLVTYGFSGLTLAATMVSGIVSARALGPDGRGITTALFTVSQLAAFLFAMGAARSLSYFIARRPADGPPLFTTWVVILLPLSAAAIALTELLLPTIFATDGEEAIAIGRWFMFTIPLAVGLELAYGLLLGVQDFLFYNWMRFAQMALVAGGLAVLWALDSLTVEGACIWASVATGIALVAGLIRALALVGAGPFDLRLGWASLWYGIRGQGAAVATQVTARLDLAMLPAFVVAASVGLYSVATSLSLIVYQVSNVFAGLVIPAAARHPERGAAKVIASLWGSLLVAAAVALVLGLFARPLLGLVYGDSFRDAAEPLVLLLPGAVLFAGSSILAAGIYAAGRPLTATIAQALGTVVTVVGLLVFLREGGITAAALVSTASYSTVFLSTLIVYKHVSGQSWRAFVPTPRRVRAMAEG
jgi:O-antigen/teichoic acid export membrane protein